jgi:hypothetical protein
MNKIYHQRFTLAMKMFITIVTLLAVYLFWFRSMVHAIIGLIVVVFLVLLIDRVVRTTYTITSDGRIIVDRGRFTAKIQFPINEIVKVSHLKTQFKLSQYILIEYGAGKTVSLQPENEKGFIDELNKRLKKEEESL